MGAALGDGGQNYPALLEHIFVSHGTKGDVANHRRPSGVKFIGAQETVPRKLKPARPALKG